MVSCLFRCAAAVINPKFLPRRLVCGSFFHADGKGVETPSVVLSQAVLSPPSSPVRSPSRKKTTIVLSTPPRQPRSTHTSPEKHIRFSVIRVRNCVNR